VSGAVHRAGAGEDKLFRAERRSDANGGVSQAGGRSSSRRLNPYMNGHPHNHPVRGARGRDNPPGGPTVPCPCTPALPPGRGSAHLYSCLHAQSCHPATRWGAKGGSEWLSEPRPRPLPTLPTPAPCLHLVLLPCLQAAGHPFLSALSGWGTPVLDTLNRDKHCPTRVQTVLFDTVPTGILESN
jgi:hypothetical protein